VYVITRYFCNKQELFNSTFTSYLNTQTSNEKIKNKSKTNIKIKIKTKIKHLSSYTHLFYNYFTAKNNACLKKENWQVLIFKVMKCQIPSYLYTI
jgi:hypothetical protein